MHQNESIKINFCNFSVAKLHFYALEFTLDSQTISKQLANKTINSHQISVTKRIKSFELLTASRRILIISSPGISSMSKPGFHGQRHYGGCVMNAPFIFSRNASWPWKPGQTSLNRVFQTFYFLQMRFLTKLFFV